MASDPRPSSRRRAGRQVRAPAVTSTEPRVIGPTRLFEGGGQSGPLASKVTPVESIQVTSKGMAYHQPSTSIEIAPSAE